MRFTKEQREAYRIEQEKIKNAWNRFDTFMSEQGWEKRHLFMRGNKWTRGENTIIYDRNGWHLNEECLTKQKLFDTIGYIENENGCS